MCDRDQYIKNQNDVTMWELFFSFNKESSWKKDVLNCLKGLLNTLHVFVTDFIQTLSEDIYTVTLDIYIKRK